MTTAHNQTRNITVAHSVETADTYFSRLFGLMGRAGLPQGHGMWITPCADIHSFFMRFSFDALFLSKTGEVLHSVSAMAPWRVSRWVRGSAGVLELPAGVIEKTQTQLGDHIIIEVSSS
ncbi:MAG: DUF192 domain-containing protein [Cyanobacteria bacterium]|nr:DUF192 domain-containing protein [Cyanobacteriota bacterium]